MSVNADDSPRSFSPLAPGWNKNQDKASYVQRWKVLRERNRNLPKIDFAVKSQIVPKRQNRGIGIGARSLTLDSMKLPSICTTSSVITTSTNMSGNTNQTLKTSRTDVANPNKQKTAGLQLTKENEEKVHSISRSLPNIATAVQNEGKTANAKHRFEKFSYTKHLQKRKHPDTKEPAKEDSNHQISLQLLEKSGIYHIDLSDLAEVSEPNSQTQTERIDRKSRDIGTIRENEPLSSRSDARKRLEKDKIGRRSRRKKWKDNCKCMRCEIMKRQFAEGDDSYTKWGIYPCQLLNKKKYYNQYFYESD